jgi:hypothetical protein
LRYVGAAFAALSFLPAKPKNRKEKPLRANMGA